MYVLRIRWIKRIVQCCAAIISTAYVSEIVCGIIIGYFSQSSESLENLFCLLLLRAILTKLGK